MPENETLSSEILREQLAENREDLRRSNRIKDKVIAALLALLFLMALLMAGQNAYHNWLWAQFDSVSVDGSGKDSYTNYIGGENSGGIHNG